jgi:Ras-related protein Rab-21
MEKEENKIFHQITNYHAFDIGAILVYDCSNCESFEKIKMWIKELKKVVGDDIVLTVVGNKYDLVKEQKVLYDPEPHIKFAKDNGATHILTSAKYNENIDELFLELSKRMIIAHDQKQEANSASINRSNSMRRRLRVEDESELENNQQMNPESSSKCCG